MPSRHLVREWDTETVLRWLGKHRLSAFAPLFAREHVNGVDLVENINRASLDALGIPHGEARDRLLSQVKKLRVRLRTHPAAGDDAGGHTVRAGRHEGTHRHAGAKGKGHGHHARSGPPVHGRNKHKHYHYVKGAHAQPRPRRVSVDQPGAEHLTISTLHQAKMQGDAPPPPPSDSAAQHGQPPDDGVEGTGSSDTADTRPVAGPAPAPAPGQRDPAVPIVLRPAPPGFVPEEGTIRRIRPMQPVYRRPGMPPPQHVRFDQLPQGQVRRVGAAPPTETTSAAAPEATAASTDDDGNNNAVDNNNGGANSAAASAHQQPDHDVDEVNPNPTQEELLEQALSDDDLTKEERDWLNKKKKKAQRRGQKSSNDSLSPANDEAQHGRPASTVRFADTAVGDTSEEEHLTLKTLSEARRRWKQDQQPVSSASANDMSEAARFEQHMRNAAAALNEGHTNSGGNMRAQGTHLGGTSTPDLIEDADDDEASNEDDHDPTVNASDMHPWTDGGPLRVKRLPNVGPSGVLFNEFGDPVDPASLGVGGGGTAPASLHDITHGILAFHAIRGPRQPLGFTVGGGSDCFATDGLSTVPPYIADVKHDGQTFGLLRRNDLLVSVNGQPCAGLTQKALRKMLSSAASPVSIIVRRPPRRETQLVGVSLGRRSSADAPLNADGTTDGSTRPPHPRANVFGTVNDTDDAVLYIRNYNGETPLNELGNLERVGLVAARSVDSEVLVVYRLFLFESGVILCYPGDTDGRDSGHDFVRFMQIEPVSMVLDTPVYALGKTPNNETEGWTLKTGDNALTFAVTSAARKGQWMSDMESVIRAKWHTKSVVLTRPTADSKWNIGIGLIDHFGVVMVAAVSGSNLAAKALAESDVLVKVNETVVAQSSPDEVRKTMDTADTTLKLTVSRINKVRDRNRVNSILTHLAAEARGDSLFRPVMRVVRRVHLVRADAISSYGFGIGDDHTGTMVVCNVEAGSPAEGSVCVGDEVLELNGKSVRGKSYDDMVGLIQQGTVIDMTVSRLSAAPMQASTWMLGDDHGVFERSRLRSASIVSADGIDDAAPTNVVIRTESEEPTDRAAVNRLVDVADNVEEVNVVISRPTLQSSFGLTLAITTDGEDHLVTAVSESGPAVGELFAGDNIVSVNGIATQGKSHQEVIAMIMAVTELRLVVARSQDMLGTLDAETRSRIGAKTASVGRRRATPTRESPERTVNIERDAETGSYGFGFVSKAAGADTPDDMVHVVVRVSDGPAMGKLSPGDTITHVNGNDTATMSNQDVVGTVTSSDHLTLRVFNDPVAAAAIQKGNVQQRKPSVGRTQPRTTTAPTMPTLQETVEEPEELATSQHPPSTVVQAALEDMDALTEDADAATDVQVVPPQKKGAEDGEEGAGAGAAHGTAPDRLPSDVLNDVFDDLDTSTEDTGKTTPPPTAATAATMDVAEPLRAMSSDVDDVFDESATHTSIVSDTVKDVALDPRMSVQTDGAVHVPTQDNDMPPDTVGDVPEGGCAEGDDDGRLKPGDLLIAEHDFVPQRLEGDTDGHHNLQLPMQQGDVLEMIDPLDKPNAEGWSKVSIVQGPNRGSQGEVPTAYFRRASQEEASAVPTEHRQHQSILGWKRPSKNASNEPLPTSASDPYASDRETAPEVTTAAAVDVNTALGDEVQTADGAPSADKEEHHDDEVPPPPPPAEKSKKKRRSFLSNFRRSSKSKSKTKDKAAAKVEETPPEPSTAGESTPLASVPEGDDEVEADGVAVDGNREAPSMYVAPSQVAPPVADPVVSQPDRDDAAPIETDPSNDDKEHEVEVVEDEAAQPAQEDTTPQQPVVIPCHIPAPSAFPLTMPSDPSTLSPSSSTRADGATDEVVEEHGPEDTPPTATRIEQEHDDTMLSPKPLQFEMRDGELTVVGAANDSVMPTDDMRHTGGVTGASTAAAAHEATQGDDGDEGHGGTTTEDPEHMMPVASSYPEGTVLVAMYDYVPQRDESGHHEYQLAFREGDVFQRVSMPPGHPLEADDAEGWSHVTVLRGAMPGADGEVSTAYVRPASSTERDAALREWEGMQPPTFDVSVNRNNGKLGLAIRETAAAEGGRGVAVSKVEPDGIAHATGKFVPGQRIYKVNGRRIPTNVGGRGATKKLTVELIKASPPDIVFTVDETPTAAMPAATGEGTVAVSNGPGNEGGDEGSGTVKLVELREEIDITRGSKGFGIRFLGGADRPKPNGDIGIYISELVPGGVAANDNRLRAGDRILEVNGTDLTDMTHDEALQTLKGVQHAAFVVSRRALEFTMTKPASGSFGMKINGGSPTSVPEYVHVYRTQPNSPANVLGVPDMAEILQVNGTPVSDMSHVDVVQLIAQGGNRLQIVVAGDGGLQHVPIFKADHDWSPEPDETGHHLSCLSFQEGDFIEAVVTERSQDNDGWMVAKLLTGMHAGATGEVPESYFHAASVEERAALAASMTAR
eukprot:m.57381 g.57381  ORF g.57381 m.57381 type:complete len:2442 (+) comp7750_c0_seq1:264-7589(+)